MTKQKNLPEPTWKEQLHAYGMSDKSIENMTFKQGDHDFFVKMNNTFQDALKDDIKEFLEEQSESIRKDVAEIVITQNERWGAVITEVMRGIDSVSKSVAEMKKEMIQIKMDNDRVHEELRKGLHKLMLTNKWWVITLRLIATGVVVYFVVKYAHNHWWPNTNGLSFLGF
jgi:hypothetical protein